MVEGKRDRNLGVKDELAKRGIVRVRSNNMLPLQVICQEIQHFSDNGIKVSVEISSYCFPSSSS